MGGKLILAWLLVASAAVHAQEILCPVNVPALPCNVPPDISVTGQAVGVDLCPNPVFNFTDVVIPGGCPNTFAITRTWTVTDDCLNNLVCTQVIQVEDIVPPEISCPVDIVLSCDQPPAPPVTGVPVVADACDPSPVITFSDAVIPGPCPQNSTVLRIWQAADACGNTAVCSQTIIIVDNAPPVVTCPANVTIECGSPVDPAALGVVTALDNCSLIITVANIDGPVTGTWPWQFDRTWTAADECGNLATCVQSITVEDTQAPVVDAAPAPLTILCGDDSVVDFWLANNGGAVANDPCSTVIWTNDFSGTVCEGSVTVTFTATDESGNAVQTTAVIFSLENYSILLTGPLTGNFKTTCGWCPKAEKDSNKETQEESGNLQAYTGAHPGMEWFPNVYGSFSSDTKPRPTTSGTGRTTGHVVYNMIPSGVETLSQPEKMVKPEIAGPAPCGCAVNSHTGNLFVQAPLLDIPAPGPGLEFTLAYNSAKTVLQHGFGNGWTFNYNLLWERQGDNVVIRRGDGRQDIFTFGDGVYTPPPGVSDTLLETGAGQFVLKNKFGLSWYFDDPAHRRLTKITNRNANELTITYQDSLPVAIRDAYGRVFQLHYQNGLLQNVTDINAEPPRTVQLEYDNEGNLRGITDPLGYNRRYQYDINRNIIQTTDPNGNLTAVEYTDDNAVKALRSAISDMSIIYDTTNRETVLSQVVGDSVQTTTYTFDTRDRVVAVQGSCCGYDVQYAYDDQNNITEITDANGNKYQYTYDSRGNVLSETAPGTFTQTFAYDDRFSQPTAWTDRNGNTVSFEPDDRGNILTVRMPLGKQFSYTYLDNGLPASYTDANGYSTTYTYDDYGYLSAIQRMQVKLSFRFDALGRPEWMVSPNGDTTSVAADALNRPVSRTDPLGYTETFRYDGNGNLLFYTDKRGFATRNYYDAHNRLTRMEAPLGVATEYAYDAKGNRIYHKDPNGNETRRGYNNKNQRISETDALGNTQSWQYDANGNLIRKTDKKGRVTSYYYDGLNRMTAITDALNQTSTYDYDANGNNVAMTSPGGVSGYFVYDSLDRLIRSEFPLTVIKNEYDPNDNLVKTIDGNGNATQYSYDALNRLTQRTDALGHVTAYLYDPNSNITAVTDPRSFTTLAEYDPMNRLTRSTDALGDTTTISYDAMGNRLAMTNPKGYTTHFFYDALNRLTTVQRPHGMETYTYDKNGNRLSVTDGGGRTTGHTYDALNRTVKVVFPDATNALYDYDATGNYISVTNENNEITTYTYDDLDRKTSMTNPAGETIYHTYDAQGNLQATSYPNGNTVRLVYDRQGRLIARYDDMGMIARWTYDARGNVVEESNGVGSTTRTAYDALNRPVSVTDPIGQTTGYTYDANGNLIQKSDRQGRTTNHIIDALNRRATETDALGNTTLYTYDANSNLSSVTDAKGNVTAYAYDGEDRLIAQTYADGTTCEYAYDAAGNRISRKDNKGDLTTYTYDARDRLILRDYPDDSDAAYAYDPAGRLSTATNNYANVQFSYDQNGRLVSETLNDHTTQYTYDIPNRKRTLVYPGGTTVEEQMDKRSRLESVGHDGEPLASWTYDFADRMTTRTFANNTVSSVQYNPNSWIQELIHKGPVPTANHPDVFGEDYVPFLHFRYTYDPEGNKLTEQKLHAPGRSEVYGHDAIYRLIKFQKGDLDTGAFFDDQSFGYDPVGNRDQFVQNGQSTTYTANEMNEYTAISGQSDPVYDANGNLIDNGLHTFRYDYENRLISVDNGSAAIYDYDALGRRTRKSALDAAENYFYDGLRVVEERRDNETILATYIHGIWTDDILYCRRFGQEYFYYPNALGSVAAVADADGFVLEQYEYDAYGKPSFLNAAGAPMPVSLAETRYLFTGRRWDEESGLYYYRARYYDPQHGRFVQRDPIGYGDGMNLYAYVGNNPVNRIDYLGLYRWDAWAKVYDAEGGLFGWVTFDYGDDIHADWNYGVDFECSKDGISVTGKTITPPAPTERAIPDIQVSERGGKCIDVRISGILTVKADTFDFSKLPWEKIPKVGSAIKGAASLFKYIKEAGPHAFFTAKWKICCCCSKGEDWEAYPDPAYKDGENPLLKLYNDDWYIEGEGTTKKCFEGAKDNRTYGRLAFGRFGSTGAYGKADIDETVFKKNTNTQVIDLPGRATDRDHVKK